jgi:hypothetical protein
MVEPSISLINKVHVYVSCALLQSFKLMELTGLCLCVYVKAMCQLMNSLGFMFVLWSMAKCEVW